MRPLIRRIADDDRGATAVEYGLIAGLIAIGIVGSLIGTKTSLNAILGTVSTQMGSASGSASGVSPGGTGSVAQPAPKPAYQATYNPSNPRASYWSQKTIASGPILSQYSWGNSWATSFTDGSSITYTKENGGVQTIDYLDPTTLTETQFVLDSAGNSNNGHVYNYSSSPFTANNKTSYMYGDTFSGTNPTSMYSGSCNPSACSGPKGAASQAFITAMNNAYSDTAIWAANAPK